MKEYKPSEATITANIEESEGGEPEKKDWYFILLPTAALLLALTSGKR